MQKKLSRIELLIEYEHAPEDSLFAQATVAAFRNCSIATVEHDRWAGTGVPFIKMGRLVRYRKYDIKKWLMQFQAMHSTTEAQLNGN